MIDFDVGASFVKGNRIVARTNILQNLYRDKAIFETPNEVIDAPRNLNDKKTAQDNPETNLQALKTDDEDESRADNTQKKRFAAEIHELGIKPDSVIVAEDSQLTNEFRQTKNSLEILQNSLRNLATHQAGDSINATAIRAKIRGLESELSLLQLRARAKYSEKITKEVVANFDDSALEPISKVRQPQTRVKLNQLLEQRAVILLENHKNGDLQLLDKKIDNILGQATNQSGDRVTDRFESVERDNIVAQNHLRIGGFESQFGQKFLEL